VHLGLSYRLNDPEELEQLGSPTITARIPVAGRVAGKAGPTSHADLRFEFSIGRGHRIQRIETFMPTK
jgi:hypothetical protein